MREINIWEKSSAAATAAWPITRRWRAGTALTPRMALNSAAGGTAVAVVTTVLLAARHALAGSTLINEDARG